MIFIHRWIVQRSYIVRTCMINSLEIRLRIRLCYKMAMRKTKRTFLFWYSKKESEVFQILYSIFFSSLLRKMLQWLRLCDRTKPILKYTPNCRLPKALLIAWNFKLATEVKIQFGESRKCCSADGSILLKDLQMI